MLLLLPAKSDGTQNSRALTWGQSWPSSAQGKASPPHDQLGNDAALADLVLLHLQAVLAHMQAVACASTLESDVPQQTEICLSHDPLMCLSLHGKLLILLSAPSWTVPNASLRAENYLGPGNGFLLFEKIGCNTCACLLDKGLLCCSVSAAEMVLHGCQSRRSTT